MLNAETAAVLDGILNEPFPISLLPCHLIMIYSFSNIQNGITQNPRLIFLSSTASIDITFLAYLG
jgi:hypothetical protein